MYHIKLQSAYRWPAKASTPLLWGLWINFDDYFLNKMRIWRCVFLTTPMG